MRKEQIPLIDRADYLHHRNQVLTVAGVTLSLFATGNIMGYSSFTIPELMNDPDSPIEVTHESLSWIASLVSIGCIVGALFGGLLSDGIGRKKTILLASILFCSGWVFIARANSLEMILIGRVLTGVASGSYSSAVQVYICEVTSPSIRGVSGAFPTLMVSLGILSIYIVGSISHWQTAAYICSFFPIFVLVYTLCLPESPVWLIAKGRQPEALSSLAWLRNDREEAEQECMRLQYLNERVQGKVSLQNFCTRFTQLSVLKPLGIGLALFFFQQFSGIYPIIFYATLIFNYANNWLSDSLQTISIGVIRTFSAFVALFLVKFFPRRVLLIVSGVMMSLSTGILGAYFYLREEMGDTGNSTELSKQIIVEINSRSLEWVPLACLLTYIAFFSFGIGVIPWFLVTELSPSDTRGISSAIAIGFCQIYQFIAVKTFLNMIDFFDTYGTFWFYSLVSFVSVFFVIFCVPETRNLNSSEIEAIFESKEKEDQNHLTLSNEEEEENETSDFA